MEKTNKNLSWFERIRKAIESDKSIMGFFDGDSPEFNIVFEEADVIPTIRIYNVDFSGFIVIKVDEERGETYKECYRQDSYTGEPFTVRMVYSSIAMLLEDINLELGETEHYPDGYISGWQ